MPYGVFSCIFLKTLFKTVEDHESIVTIIFIVISTIAFILIGKPQKLLVVVGTLNGFILPITLAVILLASKNKKIVGNYRHSNLLYVLGWLVVIFTAYMSLQTVINSFGNLMG